MACRYWPTPEILGVQRFSGAWSMGSTQRSGGRGANRFNSMGGSWYVIAMDVVENAPAGGVVEDGRGAEEERRWMRAQ
jgi:hypothetical protein